MNEWRHFSFWWLTRDTWCACLFQICLKGKVHIFKYLNIQACRTDKKPDTLDLPSLGKRCLPQPLTDRYWWLINILLVHLHTLSLCVCILNYVSHTGFAYEHSVSHISSMEDFYPNKNHGPDSGIGSDNGDKRLSTTEVRDQTLPLHDEHTRLLPRTFPDT